MMLSDERPPRLLLSQHYPTSLPPSHSSSRAKLAVWVSCLDHPDSVSLDLQKTHEREMAVSTRDELLYQFRLILREELNNSERSTCLEEERASESSGHTQIDEDGLSSWSRQTAAEILATTRRKRRPKK